MESESPRINTSIHYSFEREKKIAVFIIEICIFIHEIVFMKKSILFILFVALSNMGIAQSLRDFKTKSTANSAERTQMLDLMRERVYDHVQQDVVFVVNHFKVMNDYAFFEGWAQRKDGKVLKMPEDYNDCCYCGALFKKTNGKWHILEGATFPSDLWYDSLTERFPNAPHAILSETAKFNNK
jgi:hypothetical protein